MKDSAFSNPIVAAVNGDCVAGGLLLISIDIRAAAPAARFGLTEVKWSIYPFGGATVKLVHQVGYVHSPTTGDRARASPHFARASRRS